ncbi:hypothetical protein [Amycolatopsis sp. NPDC059021]|uniref:hypothetical protein n=1 Tax=Amycolatopsis sp. NPDC059021 TaxID=3346704 RepID=UPI00366D66A2
MAENWVDPERMAKSADGFDTQADDIWKLAQRARELGDPERVRAAAGDDPDGHKFGKTHLELAGQVFDGIDLWGKSVKATGDGIRAAAHTYTKAEDNATEAAARLRRAGSGDGAAAGGGAAGSVPATARIKAHSGPKTLAASGGTAEASLRVAPNGPDRPLWTKEGKGEAPPVLLSGSGKDEGVPASARVAARGGPHGAVLPGEPLKPVDGPPVLMGKPGPAEASLPMGGLAGPVPPGAPLVPVDGGGAAEPSRPFVSGHDGPHGPLWKHDGAGDGPPVLLGGAVPPGAPLTPVEDGGGTAEASLPLGGPAGPVPPGAPLVPVENPGGPTGPHAHDDLIAPSASTGTHTFAERED